MPDVVGLCVLPKRDYGMPCPTWFDRVRYQKAVRHVLPDVVQPSVLSKGGDDMPRPTLSDLACSPREVVSCHARHCLTVCAVKGR